MAGSIGTVSCFALSVTSLPLREQMMGNCTFFFGARQRAPDRHIHVSPSTAAAVVTARVPLYPSALRDTSGVLSPKTFQFSLVISVHSLNVPFVIFLAVIQIGSLVKLYKYKNLGIFFCRCELYFQFMLRLC